MATRDKDEFHGMADYYNGRIPVAIDNLRSVLAELPQSENGLKYSELLSIKRAFEDIEQAVQRRDMFGTHSDTGRLWFRHVAHPGQFPAPNDEKVAAPV